MSTQHETILVVGGGLGGLATAAALGQAGRHVKVLEQAPEISAIGYGIQLGPNVFKVFDRLGISEAVKTASGFPPAVTILDADSGKNLLQVPLASDEYNQRFQHPYVVIHRADIHHILMEACLRAPSVELITDASVVAYKDLGDSVQVQCSDGRSFQGAALIAADGLKSRTRAALIGDGDPKSIGYVAHRTIVDMKDVPPGLPHIDEVVLWGGPGYHVVHYPLRDGTLFNIVAVFKDPAPSHGDRYVTHAEDVKHVYENAHPALKQILSMMNLERRWVIGDRDPIRKWNQNRVTLLGDAAHATLQSYAQGAGMAIEDADCLARLLSQYDTPKAFDEFSKCRVIRTARLQLESRLVWEFYHAEGISRDVRNAELSERTQEDTYKCLEWLWKGDCTFENESLL